MKIQITKVKTETFWIDTEKPKYFWFDDDVKEFLEDMKTMEDWEEYYAETEIDETPFEEYYKDYDTTAKCEIIEQ